MWISIKTQKKQRERERECVCVCEREREETVGEGGVSERRNKRNKDLMLLYAHSTGHLVYKKLKERLNLFVARGLVRSETSKEKINSEDDAILIADIRERESLDAPFSGVNVLIILTSASPQIKPGFDPSKGGPPEFYYKEGEYPEEVKLRLHNLV